MGGQLTVRSVQKAAKQFGGTVDGGVIGRYASYNIDAPEGKRWAAAGVHALSMGWHADGPTGAATWPKERQEALQDAIERISIGVEDCDDPDCDICHPEVSEPAGAYTPGPWKYENGEVTTPDGDRLLLTGVSLTTGNHPKAAEAKANTRLAAASLKLLAFAKAYCKLFNENDLEPEEACESLYHRAMAIIAEAEEPPPSST